MPRYLLANDCFWSVQLSDDVKDEEVLDLLCRFLLGAGSDKKTSDPSLLLLLDTLKSKEEFGCREITRQILMRQIKMLSVPRTKTCPTCKAPWPVSPGKPGVRVFRGTDADGDPGVWALSESDIRDGWKPHVVFVISSDPGNQPDHLKRDSFGTLPDWFHPVRLDEETDGSTSLVTDTPILPQSVYPSRSVWRC